VDRSIGAFVYSVALPSNSADALRALGPIADIEHAEVCRICVRSSGHANHRLLARNSSGDTYPERRASGVEMLSFHSLPRNHLRHLQHARNFRATLTQETLQVL